MMKQLDMKLTIEQLKNYLGTGLKYELQVSCHEDFDDLEFCSEFDRAFTKGALWDFVGWSDIELPLGEGEFESELLQFEKGVYKGNYKDSIPLMYRLSDLDKHIPQLGFVPTKNLHTMGFGSNYLNEIRIGDVKYSDFSHKIIQQLFQWHFWPFGDQYFTEGLVIDKLNYGK